MLCSVRAAIQHHAQTVWGGRHYGPSSHITCSIPSCCLLSSSTHRDPHGCEGRADPLQTSLGKGSQTLLEYLQLSHPTGFTWLGRSQPSSVKGLHQRQSRGNTHPHHPSSIQTEQQFLSLPALQWKPQQFTEHSAALRHWLWIMWRIKPWIIGFKGRDAYYLQLKRLLSCRDTEPNCDSLPNYLCSLERMYGT